MVFDRVYLADVSAVAAAGPLTKQAHLELLRFRFTTATLLFKLPQLCKIAGRPVDRSLDHVSQLSLLELAFKLILFPVQILIDLIIHLSHLFRKSIPKLINLLLQSHIVKIVHYVELQLIVMIVKNVCELVSSLELILVVKG
jgi:hypothetical protein